MLLGNKDFSHYKIMNYTNDLFIETFSDNIKLMDYKFTEEAMGYYKLTYEYLPKNYRIEFECDRLYFSIEIFRKDKEFSSINQIKPNQMPQFNNLKKENIKKGITLLHTVLMNHEEFFYTVKRNKLIKIET